MAGYLITVEIKKTYEVEINAICELSAIQLVDDMSESELEQKSGTPKIEKEFSSENMED